MENMKIMDSGSGKSEIKSIDLQGKQEGNTKIE